MPFSRSSWTIELNVEPEGSCPTRLHRSEPARRPSAIVRVNTFDMLWMENAVSVSPAVAAAAVNGGYRRCRI